MQNVVYLLDQLLTAISNATVEEKEVRKDEVDFLTLYIYST